MAKGGNLLLNVGPDAKGNLPDTAVLRMKEIGKWMKVNGEAIYKTRPLYPYCVGNWRFTQSKDGHYIYAIYLLDEGQPMPEVVTLPDLGINASAFTVLGKGKVHTKKNGGNSQLFVQPQGGQEHALVIKIKQ